MKAFAVDISTSHQVLSVFNTPHLFKENLLIQPVNQKFPLPLPLGTYFATAQQDGEETSDH
jgi:hypothetical protein